MEVLPKFDVRLMGRFRIFRDGEEVAAPKGHAGTLFTILVLNGGVVHREALVGHLWPADPPARGQARLRNVLHRARQTGAAIESHGGQTVVLGNEFTCDLTTFIHDGTQILASPAMDAPARRESLRVQALWTGPPLEQHRYALWAQPWRQRAFDVQARLWELIDWQSHEQGGLERGAYRRTSVSGETATSPDG
jgi:DNA-binding SARP family transcriptional activator